MASHPLTKMQTLSQSRKTTKRNQRENLEQRPPGLALGILWPDADSASASPRSR